MTRSTILLAGIPALLLLRQLWRYTRTPARLSKIAQSEERVLVLGGGTGIGREIAKQYLDRGAKVCIVGRRQDKLDAVVQEAGSPNRLLSFVGDVSAIDDMVTLREILVNEWNGCDTLILSAGVSALQPILGVAGIDNPDTATVLPDVDKEGIRKALAATEAATRVNYYGPLIVAVTFIPLLTRSSKSPSILLVSSLGATIPSPTRALYGSTKAASLHPSIAFSCVLPATVEGAFRESAVDMGVVREVDPDKHGLKVAAVAKRCIQAVDNLEKPSSCQLLVLADLTKR
ncbi:NAD(P)-binding protein [Hymenopellis radicata]|nr:NAD(P)-binding protein [Hymenopellis radicata]